MFFVSLLLNQTLSWIRTQPGTSSLRAILYMDEIFGYFPPVANPPSKQPLLTLLKQARAFGLGVVLATQNPVDSTIKAWRTLNVVSRLLQTGAIRDRVPEGLEGAGSNFDRGELTRCWPGLGKRVFLMNNVHEKQPVLFETRWTLSYLRGPLARPEIQKLMQGRNLKRSRVLRLLSAKEMVRATSAGQPVLPGHPQYYFPFEECERDRLLACCGRRGQDSISRR
jgi:hypothetical protein